jgi:polyhydroxybutyrate depolymerase
MPRGITKSWNAIECCGVALDTHLDDVGFINAAVYEMLGKGHVDSGAVFATGFSNGGFMTSRIALQQSSHSNSSAAWLVAAAPTAGELGDGSLYDAATVAVPVMLHHSIEDTAVRSATSLCACLHVRLRWND